MDLKQLKKNPLLVNINLENLASKGKLNIVVDRTEEAKEIAK